MTEGKDDVVKILCAFCFQVPGFKALGLLYIAGVFTVDTLQPPVSFLLPPRAASYVGVKT